MIEADSFLKPAIEDEPQHQLMGPITPALLDVIQVPHQSCPTSDNEIPAALASAQAYMDDKARCAMTASMRARPIFPPPAASRI